MVPIRGDSSGIPTGFKGSPSFFSASQETAGIPRHPDSCSAGWWENGCLEVMGEQPAGSPGLLHWAGAPRISGSTGPPAQHAAEWFPPLCLGENFSFC